MLVFSLSFFYLLIGLCVWQITLGCSYFTFFEKGLVILYLSKLEVVIRGVCVFALKSLILISSEWFPINYILLKDLIFGV